MVEDNDYSSSSQRVQVIVVGEAKILQIHTQPSLCSVAGEHLFHQPAVSVHDALGNLVEQTHHLRVLSSLLAGKLDSFQNASVFQWQGQFREAPVAGYGAYSDLVIFKSGWFAVRFSAVALEPAISEVFNVIPGPAKQLLVLGFESGCFFQEHVLSPQIQIGILDLFGNIMEITRLMVNASVLASRTYIVSFTRSKYQDFQLPENTTFCGRILFETTVQTNPNAFASTTNNTEEKLEYVSQPLCVVSSCGPGQERQGCSSQNMGECAQCPMGTYSLKNIICIRVNLVQKCDFQHR